MTITKNDLLKYLLELIIVAFGVFLGMFVSDWNTTQKTKRQVEKTLEYIVDELESNAKSLGHAIEYHEQLKVVLDSIMLQLTEEEYMATYIKNGKFRMQTLPVWKGPGSASLERSVFEGAKIGNIFQELDIETLQLISKTYTKQDEYKIISQKVVDKLLDLDMDTKVIDVIGIGELLVYDVKSTEKWLKKELEKTIEKLVLQ